jgi:hypothetical protein
MIERIGVVCQDRNSFGFLQGIRRRLKCAADLVEPTTGGLGKSTTMTRRQAKLAALDLQRKRVDLLVRFTDADGGRWQEIARHEQAVFPAELGSMLVCGIAFDNTEQWLGLDRKYIGKVLEIPDVEAIPKEQLTGVIKNAIAQQRQSDEPVWEVTARLVAQAPADVFRLWLKCDESLREFYRACRHAALRQDCEVPNELD